MRTSRNWLMLAMSCTLLGWLALSSGCSGSQPQRNVKPVIKIAYNLWTASELNAQIARILISEELGMPVELVEIDEYEVWPELAAGKVHANLEVWVSGHQEDLKKYVESDKTVEDGGVLGPVGKIGWYLPGYLLADHPELASWEGLKDPDNAALFATAATGDKGQFLSGDPSWTQYDEQIINNLGLNFQIVQAGSEDAIIAALDEAYKIHTAVLVYFWTPHWAFVQYDLAPVALPPYSDACYAKAAQGGVDCDYPPDPLMKVFWSGFQDYSPEAYELLKNFNYTNLDQIGMLAAVQLDGKTTEEAARDWINANEAVWRAWLP